MYCQLSCDPGQVNTAVVMVEYIEPENTCTTETKSSLQDLQTHHPHKQFLEYMDTHKSSQEHLSDAILQGMRRLSLRVMKHKKATKQKVRGTTSDENNYNVCI